MKKKKFVLLLMTAVVVAAITIIPTKCAGDAAYDDSDTTTIEEAAVVVDEVVLREPQDDFGLQWVRTKTQSGRFGAESSTGKVILEPIFTDVVYSPGEADGIFNAYLNDTVAIFDKTGKNIVSPNFGVNYCTFYCDEDEANKWIGIQKDDLFGAMTMTGDMIIPPAYKEVAFIWGRFILKQTDGKWISMMIDTEGNSVAKPEGRMYVEGVDDRVLGHLTSYYEVVGNNGLVGVEDENGREIVPQVYDEIIRTRVFYAKRNGYIAVYDIGGKCLIPLSRQYNSATYSSNYIEVRRGYNIRQYYFDNGFYSQLNNGYEDIGVCNLAGDEIVAPGKYEIVEDSYSKVSYTDSDGNRHTVSLNNPRFKETPIWVRKYLIEDNAVEAATGRELVSGMEQVVEIAYFGDYIIEDGYNRCDLKSERGDGTKVFHNVVGWGGGSDYTLSPSGAMAKISYNPGFGPVAPFTTRQSMRVSEEAEVGFRNSGRTPPTLSLSVHGETDNTSSSAASPQTVSADPLRCNFCGGSGRREINQSVANFGTGSYKKKCDECGKWFFADSGHGHIECRYCHGTGRQ